MRNYTHSLALMAAVSFGGLALFLVGFFVALAVRSALADPGGPVSNPGHAWTELQDHGVSGSDYWLGTTDNNALELWVNNARALRLEPRGVSPNIIGGYSGNSVTAGALGAAVCGGGSSGNTNRVTDDYGTVAGGYGNQAGDNAGSTVDRPYTTVGGGGLNYATLDSATVCGGWNNDATASYATISGGSYNDATAGYATVGGGDSNTASGGSSTIAGGKDNTASATNASVGGGWRNTASANYATVDGGEYNRASDWYATVGGGQSNTASFSHATVGGGYDNTASEYFATVGGGRGNEAAASYATIAGGGESTPGDANTRNRVTDEYGTVGGGGYNMAGDNAGSTTDRRYATVGGGYNNIASGVSATVGGGYWNIASGPEASVGGGDTNEATGDHATIGGGLNNNALSGFATVGGGHTNTASVGSYSTVGGGEYNWATALDATVGGGYSNDASGPGRSTVGGGYDNTASGNAATVPGGASNVASGAYSFAAGAGASATHVGSFVWASAEAASSWGDNTFTARTQGGARFYTASGTGTGVQLAAGGNAWSAISDRSVKENFTPVDGQEVLARLADVPISTWNLKSQDASIRHMGPVAQDLYAAFGLGENERYISTVDADGVALAAIQGLYSLVQEQDARIQTLEEENANLQQRLGDLETRVTALEGGAGTSGASAGPLSGFTAGWLALGGLGIVAGLLLVQRRRAGGER